MRKDSSASNVLEFQRLGDQSKFAGNSPDAQGSLHIEIKRNSFRSGPPQFWGHRTIRQFWRIGLMTSAVLRSGFCAPRKWGPLKSKPSVDNRDSFRQRPRPSFLEVGTAFKDWIARRIEDFGFLEGQDFSAFLSESTGGRNQFGRRNLDAYQRTKLALRLEEAIAGRAKARMLSTQNNNAAKQNSAELDPIETREEIAKLAGVSRDTVAGDLF
jgi:hypothetical protein